MNPLTVSVFLIIDFVASRVERQQEQEEAQFAAFRKKNLIEAKFQDRASA